MEVSGDERLTCGSSRSAENLFVFLVVPAPADGEVSLARKVPACGKAGPRRAKDAEAPDAESFISLPAPIHKLAPG